MLWNSTRYERTPGEKMYMQLGQFFERKPDMYREKEKCLCWSTQYQGFAKGKGEEGMKRLREVGTLDKIDKSRTI